MIKGQEADLLVVTKRECMLSPSVVSYSLRHGLARQAPLSVGFPRKEYWSGLLFPLARDLPDPGIEPKSLVSLSLAGGFFTPAPPGKPK